jgi:hypothetical protein
VQVALPALADLPAPLRRFALAYLTLEGRKLHKTGGMPVNAGFSVNRELVVPILNAIFREDRVSANPDDFHGAILRAVGPVECG